MPIGGERHDGRAALLYPGSHMDLCEHLNEM